MDDLELICPCCNAQLEIDSVGDLALVKLPELAQGQQRGLGGLVTEHVNFDQRALYLANQQGQIEEQPKMSFELPKLNRAKPDAAPVQKIESDPKADAAVLKANSKDLKSRNIKTNSKSK